MPRLIPIRLAAACALALILVLSAPRPRWPRRPVASLRVVGKGGKVLAEDSFGAGPRQGPDEPEGRLLRHRHRRQRQERDDQGPDRARHARPGGEVHGGAEAGADHRRLRLRPRALRRSASRVATTKLSWYLKVNHKNPEIGGESVKVKAGDEVLWALAAFPYPNELSLTAPDRATAGPAVRGPRLLLRRQGEAQAGRRGRR